MKRILFTIFCGIAGFFSANSQIMQASIGLGTLPNRVIIYIRPTTTLTAGNISTLQFDVAILASVSPIPTLSIVGSPTIGSGWVIDAPYVEAGNPSTPYRHYQITTGSSFPVTIGAGVETAVMELQFNGGPALPNSVSLITLPGGGSTFNALFFCSGAANSDENFGLYYNGGPGTLTTSVVNHTSYTGTLNSSATIGNIILPIKWLGFNAVKQNNDALINWSVAEEDITNHYELQRSLNGIDFATVATINKTGTGAVTQNYTYTDPQITGLGSQIIYYRLKEVDLDGRSFYSDIRKINISLRTDIITVYPNPVKDGFYVIIPFLQQSTKKDIQLILTSSGGQAIQTKEISSLQATNYYFDLKGLSLASGNYFLQIFHDGTLLDKKQLFVNKE